LLRPHGLPGCNLRPGCATLPLSGSPQTSLGEEGGGGAEASKSTRLSFQSVGLLPAQIGAAGEERKGRGGGLPRPPRLQLAPCRHHYLRVLDPSPSVVPPLTFTCTSVASDLHCPSPHQPHVHLLPPRRIHLWCVDSPATPWTSPTLERRPGGGGEITRPPRLPPTRNLLPTTHVVACTTDAKILCRRTGGGGAPA
jgi:hypothetical protein